MVSKILVLGGTQFIGRRLVERLLACDAYDVTLFNRQQSQSNLFPEVKKIKGDRNTQDVEQLSDQDWDYVIDLSCYYPDSLQEVLSQLRKLKKYIFISTCSVYDNTHCEVQLRDESADTLSCSEDQSMDQTTASYGNRKAECERILMTSSLNYTILRPALVYGTYDYTDRFYYWLYQVKASNTLLLPDMGKRLFSITYVEDLVETIFQSIQENRLEGVFNAITVPQASISQIVSLAQKDLNQSNEMLNASAAFLKQQQINQWLDMPLWIDGDFFTYSNKKLCEELDNPLSSFEESVIETIEYYGNLGWHVPKYGMTEQKRMSLIERLKKETLEDDQTA